MRRILIWALLIVLALGAAVVVQSWRVRSAGDPADALADSLQVLRAAAESCRADLDADVATFDTFDASLDSLRQRVRAFEALHPRGVPADSYDAYLAVFDQYNDSAGSFEHRADTLRARLERCRSVTQRHNTIADSLRRLLAERQAAERATQ